MRRGEKGTVGQLVCWKRERERAVLGENDLISSTLSLFSKKKKGEKKERKKERKKEKTTLALM
jgi:hypothetical protein